MWPHLGFHTATAPGACCVTSIGTLARMRRSSDVLRLMASASTQSFVDFFVSVLLPRYEGAARYIDVKAKVACYHALSDVVDLLQLSKFGRRVVPELPGDKIHIWIRAHQFAYGTSLCYLNTNWTGHSPDVHRRRSESIAIIMACWALDLCVHTSQCTRADLTTRHQLLSMLVSTHSYVSVHAV